MDSGEEISCGFVVTGRDGSILLELAIEVFHEVARLVQLLVIVAADFATALGWDYGRFPGREQRLNDALIGIESLVCQQGVGLHLRQERVGTFQIVDLARSQEESQRIAKCIDKCMNLGAQSAFAAPDRLVFALFFWAPALC